MTVLQFALNAFAVSLINRFTTKLLHDWMAKFVQFNCLGNKRINILHAPFPLPQPPPIIRTSLFFGNLTNREMKIWRQKIAYRMERRIPVTKLEVFISTVFYALFENIPFIFPRQALWWKETRCIRHYM